MDNWFQSGLKKVGGFLKERFLGPDISQEEYEIFQHESKKGHKISKELQDRHIKGGALSLSIPTSVKEYLGSKALSESADFLDNIAQGRFKYHGQNAGPNYSLGKFYGQNEVITKNQLKKRSGDKLDDIYLQHDLLYTKASLYGTPEQREKALRHADQVFVKKAKEYVKNHDLSLVDSIKTNTAIKAFEAKQKLGVGYKIDQLDRPYYVDDDGNYKWTTHEEVNNTVNEHLKEYDFESLDIPNETLGYDIKRPANNIIEKNQLMSNEVENEFGIAPESNFTNIADDPKSKADIVKAIQAVLFAVDDNEDE